MHSSQCINSWNDDSISPSPRRPRHVLLEKADDFANCAAMPSLMRPSRRRMAKLVETKKWESMRMPKVSPFVDIDQPIEQTSVPNCNSNKNNNRNKTLRRGLQRTESMRLPVQPSSAVSLINNKAGFFILPDSPSRPSRLRRTKSMRLPTLMQQTPLDVTSSEEPLSPPAVPARPGLTRRWESTPCIQSALVSPQRRRSIEQEEPIAPSNNDNIKRNDMMKAAKRWESMSAMSPQKPKRTFSPTPMNDISRRTEGVNIARKWESSRPASKSANLCCPKPQRRTSPLPFAPLTGPQVPSSASALPASSSSARRAEGILAARKWESSRPALQRWESQSTDLGCSKPGRRGSTDHERHEPHLARPTYPRWSSQSSNLGSRPKLLRTDSQATNLGESNPMLRVENKQILPMIPKLQRMDSQASCLEGSNRSMRPTLQRMGSRATNLGGSNRSMRPKLQRTDSQAASLGGSSSMLWVSEEQATPTSSRPKLKRTDSQATNLGGSSSSLRISGEQGVSSPTRPTPERTKSRAANQHDSLPEDPRRSLLASCNKQDKAWTSALSLASPATNRARKLLSSRGWQSFLEQKNDGKAILKTISAPTCHREGSEKIQTLREKLKQKRDSLTAALQASQRSLQASSLSASVTSEIHDMDAHRVLMMSKFKAINKRTSDSLNQKRERLAKARALAAEYFITFPTIKDSQYPELNENPEQPDESVHEIISDDEDDVDDEDPTSKKLVCGGLSEYFSFSKRGKNMSQRALDTTMSSMPDLVSIREDDDSAFLDDDDGDSTLASRSVLSNDCL